jgi:hypothetical protein
MSVYEKAKNRRLNAPEWKRKLVHELLKPKRKQFKRRRVTSYGVDRIWTADLADLKKYVRQNQGYRYILVVLDVFSRYAWARPLKNKTGETVTSAFKDIFHDGHKPTRLWTDEGKEFYNATMYRMLEANNIELYSTHNEPKAMIAERFIRTLRKKIESNYILTMSTVWYDILPQLIHEYNTTYHRSIRMTPEEARKPENLMHLLKLETWKRKRKLGTPKFKVGDKVRISVHKGIFTKEATANWSEEIFEVYKVDTDTQPVTYRLKDLVGEVIEGAFYNEQLQKTDQQIYRIDRILRKRKGNNGIQEVYVRWSGYPNKFCQWIPAADVLQSGIDVHHVG